MWRDSTEINAIAYTVKALVATFYVLAHKFMPTIHNINFFVFKRLILQNSIDCMQFFYYKGQRSLQRKKPNHEPPFCYTKPDIKVLLCT